MEHVPILWSARELELALRNAELPDRQTPTKTLRAVAARLGSHLS